jgi:signal transduction histidine kinase
MQLERALDVVSDVFVVFDRDFRLVYHNEANRSAMRAAGMDPDAAIGRDVLEAMPQLAGTMGLAECRRALAERVPTSWEETYHPDLRLRGRAYPTADGGIIVVASDITAEWKAKGVAERSVEWANQFHRLSARLAAAATLEDLGQIVLEEARFTLGIDHGTVHVREPGGDTMRHVASIGYEPHQLEGWVEYSLQGASVSRDALETGRAVFAQSRAEARERFGSALAAVLEQNGVGSIAVVPVGVLGAERLLFGFTWDAERPFSEDDRRYIETFSSHSAQAFQRALAFESEREARAAAEDANRAKADFLAAMSHELRTPLNAIGGYTDLLAMGLRGPLTEKQRDDLRRISRNQAHLMSIINDILNFARLEAGSVDLELTTVPAREILGGIEPIIAPQIEQKQLRFWLGECDPSISVWADREKVQQVLLNLLTNAAKFTHAGGRVTLSVLHDSSLVSIRVTDDGVGIPPDKLEAIFEPFVQVHRSLTQPTPGTGLGLAISRDLARKMGGDITVESIQGEGSTFTLALPRA